MNHPITDALTSASTKMFSQLGVRPAVIRMTTGGLWRLRAETGDKLLWAGDINSHTFDGIRIELDDTLADADIQIAPPAPILDRTQVEAIQAELRRIADSFDTDPPSAHAVMQSAVIVDEDSAFSLTVSFSPY